MSNELVLLYTGLLLLFTSVIYHFLNKERYSIFFLVLSSFFLFLSASFFYPFINLWDERFHALVAKNLMNHPLMPTLYDDPVVNMLYSKGWDTYHIWLHKQPLFMWQIALSYKLFGVNEFALRLPSVILSSMLVFAGYRAGKILGNKNVGYYTGFLIATSSYLWQLISGRIEVDQNDVSFIVYISLSFWTWFEYVQTKKLKWLLLIGVFSGFAILCKWLVGLLVYLAWGLYSIIDNKFQFKKYWDILLSFLITVLVFLPWQILTFKWYPVEAKLAFQHNASHFMQVIEGHSGPFFYHFFLMPRLFGSLVPYLIIPALIVFYLRTSHKKISIVLTISILFVYLFFSITATKMPSFTSVIIILLFISLAFLIDFIIDNFQKLRLPPIIQNTILVTAFLLFIYFRIDLVSIIKDKSLVGIGYDEGYKEYLSHNKKVFQNLLLPQNAVIFNVGERGRHYIEAMYYTGLPAYSFIPSEEQCIDMKNKKRLIAIFKPKDGVLPDYLEKNNDIIVLKDTLDVCE
ncbi:MAG: glycosyltransferase family 39 protein [Bacteroidia bacterium]